MNLECSKLTITDFEEIKTLFKSVFTNEPWNDDWSDDNQLNQYIMDLIANSNALTLGLFQENALLGLCMGSIVHWYTGTQYNIQELCVATKEQGRGLGTKFLKHIENYLFQNKIYNIFLQTQRTVPAYEFYQKNRFSELSDHVSLVKGLGCDNK